MDHESYEIDGADRSGPWLVTVDHASARVPDAVSGGNLGLSDHDMARHIAFDIGALGLARALGRALNGPVVASRFSRLVIDPNRGEDDPTLVMQLYDGSIIPANRAIPAQDVQMRLETYYRPYHGAIAALAQARAGATLLAVHSFTPQLRGRPPRPWHVGVLYAKDDRLARPLLQRLRAEPGIVVGDNQPYTGALQGDAMDRHGVQPGRRHVLIELRNDLIATPQGQQAWAKRLAPILQAALRDCAPELFAHRTSPG